MVTKYDGYQTMFGEIKRAIGPHYVDTCASIGRKCMTFGSIYKPYNNGHCGFKNTYQYQISRCA